MEAEAKVRQRPALMGVLADKMKLPGLVVNEGVWHASRSKLPSNSCKPSMKIVGESRQRSAKSWNWRWWTNSDRFRHIVIDRLLMSLCSLLARWRRSIFVSALALLPSWLLLLFIITIVTAATMASAVAKATSVATSADSCAIVSVGGEFGRRRTDLSKMDRRQSQCLALPQPCPA